MSRPATLEWNATAAPPLDRHYLITEIIVAAANADWTIRQCVWDKAEAWGDYLERCLWWLYCWNRGTRPMQLHRCDNCGRIDQPEPGRAICFACNAEQLVA